jgi:hypothetical protein
MLTTWAARLVVRVACGVCLVAVSLLNLGCESDTSAPPDTIDCESSAVVPDAGLAGVIYTFAGTGRNGYVRENEPRLEARFSLPADLEFDAQGNAFVLDWNNHMVRRIGSNGMIHTVMGNIPPFPGDGPQPYYPQYNDLTAPVQGQYCFLNHPTDLDLLPDGNFVLTAWHNHKLRLYDPVLNTEKVISGRGAGFAGDGQPHTTAGNFYSQPSQGRLGPDGHFYILDQRNQRIRRIRDLMTDPAGILETVAGSGGDGYNGDGLATLATEFNWDSSTNPRQSGGMTIGADGVIYVSDTKNHIVRAIDLVADRVRVVAGIPESPGSGGDGGQGTSAQLNWPMNLEFGPDGRLYIADEDNHAVRALDLSSGVLTTVAGQLGKTSSDDCLFPPSQAIGDGKPATQAVLRNPRGLAFDAAGRLYIVDSFHHRIRVLTLED